MGKPTYEQFLAAYAGVIKEGVRDWYYIGDRDPVDGKPVHWRPTEQKLKYFDAVAAPLVAQAALLGPEFGGPEPPEPQGVEVMQMPMQLTESEFQRKKRA